MKNDLDWNLTSVLLLWIGCQIYKVPVVCVYIRGLKWEIDGVPTDRYVKVVRYDKNGLTDLFLDR